MSKELDALERGIIEFEKDLEDDCNNEWLKRVVAGMKKCYQRLESIDNANPSEALECLKSLDIQTRFIGILDVPSWEKYLPIIKQSLLKAQEQEKVLEIIKEKNVDIVALELSKTVDDYNIQICTSISASKELTEEEFDLLKRYLNAN